MHTPVRLLPELTFGLGESPVWDGRNGCLYWVDIKAPALHRLDPESGAHTHWDWPEVISCCGLAQSGAVVVSGRSGLWGFDPSTGRRELTHPIPTLADDVRTNDGKIGPDGAFWVSTMQDRSDRGPTGVVMRIDPDGEVQTLLEGITTANGIEWSHDGRRFYLADTRELWIDCWDYDPKTVALTNRRRFVTFKEDEGKPDGGTIDANGSYWSSGIYGGKIHRLGPQGERLASISMPTKMTTMPCFGGADLKTLFVTSLTPDGGDLTVDGGLYSVSVDVAGRLPYRFGSTVV